MIGMSPTFLMTIRQAIAGLWSLGQDITLSSFGQSAVVNADDLVVTPDHLVDGNMEMALRDQAA